MRFCNDVATRKVLSTEKKYRKNRKIQVWETFLFSEFSDIYLIYWDFQSDYIVAKYRNIVVRVNGKIVRCGLRSPILNERYIRRLKITR